MRTKGGKKEKKKKWAVKKGQFVFRSILRAKSINRSTRIRKIIASPLQLSPMGSDAKIAAEVKRDTFFITALDTEF